MKRIINKEDIIYLHPGNAIVTNKNKIIYTILGSCIAVTMHIPRLKIGAIAHCLLPEPRKTHQDEQSQIVNEYKYVSSTIPLMLQSLKEMGANLNEVEVKIFGGANLISGNNEKEISGSIGSKNFFVAKDLLEKNNIKIKACDTGGNIGRKIYFFSDSGEIYLNKLGKFDLANEIKKTPK